MDFDVYHSYTQALRHPVIIGHVAGWRLPWALSASQLGAVAAMSGLLLVTRPVWAHLGPVGNLAVFTLAVAGMGWAVRHWRIEGRSPFLVAAGVAVVLVSPGCRWGVRNGRPVTRPRSTRGCPVGVTITPGRDVGRSHTDG
ncbi:MAG TPA: hypothetical protein ENH00_11340 [Actinobacteria bacterium]|nr:hypothetical protein [Actinomycetota bacterium]